MKLSKKKRQWLGNRTTNLNGNHLNPSVTVANRYYHAIDRVLIYINSLIKDRFDPVKDINDIYQFRDALHNIITENIASSTINYFSKKMALEVNKNSNSTLNRSIKKLTGNDLGIGKVSELDANTIIVLERSIEENTSLVSSIYENYRDKLTSDIDKFIIKNDGDFRTLVENIHGSLKSRFKEHRNKAKNIALDQTRKIYTDLNLTRMVDLGIKKFKWIHTGGGKTSRQLHIEYNNRVFDIDNPPIIDEKTQEKGFPSDAINCRCVMAPVLEFENGVEKNV